MELWGDPAVTALIDSRGKLTNAQVGEKLRAQIERGGPVAFSIGRCSITGTESLRTRRWSKGDSNSWSHPERQRSERATWVPPLLPVSESRPPEKRRSSPPRHRQWRRRSMWAFRAIPRAASRGRSSRSMPAKRSFPPMRPKAWHHQFESGSLQRRVYKVSVPVCSGSTGPMICTRFVMEGRLTTAPGRVCEHGSPLFNMTRFGSKEAAMVPRWNATPCSSWTWRTRSPTSGPKTVSIGRASGATTRTASPRARNDGATSRPIKLAPMTTTRPAPVAATINALLSASVRK